MDIKIVTEKLTSYKLPIFVGGVIILLLILWWTGAVGSGISAWNRMIVAKEKKITDTLKGEIKVITEKLKAVEKKEKAKDGEIAVLKKDQQKIKEELDGIKNKKQNIIIPTDTSAMANEFKQFGFSSVTVVRR